MERMRQRGMAWGGRVGKEVRGRDVEREKVDFMSGVKKSTIINRDRNQFSGGIDYRSGNRVGWIWLEV